MYEMNYIQYSEQYMATYLVLRGWNNINRNCIEGYIEILLFTMQAQIDMVEQMKTRHDMPLFRGQSSRKIIPIMFLDIVEKRACTKKSQNQTGLVITLTHSFVLVVYCLD